MKTKPHHQRYARAAASRLADATDEQRSGALGAMSASHRAATEAELARRTSDGAKRRSRAASSGLALWGEDADDVIGGLRRLSEEPRESGALLELAATFAREVEEHGGRDARFLEWLGDRCVDLGKALYLRAEALRAPAADLFSLPDAATPPVLAPEAASDVDVEGSAS